MSIEPRPKTATERVIEEWDMAMMQARAVAEKMPEYGSCSRDERLALAHAIFLRNAIKSAGNG